MSSFIRNLRFFTIIPLTIVATACAHSVSSDGALSDEQVNMELMAADRAYASHNLEYSYKMASSEFIDFDTAFMIEAGEGFLVGESDIMSERQLDAVPSPVHWAPIGAMGASSGDLGITWGAFSVDGDPETTGNYVTVWRKVNGEWKIVTDVAVDDPVAP